jgi:hypothetical protein
MRWSGPCRYCFGTKRPWVQIPPPRRTETPGHTPPCGKPGLVFRRLRRSLGEIKFSQRPAIPQQGIQHTAFPGMTGKPLVGSAVGSPALPTPEVTTAGPRKGRTKAPWHPRPLAHLAAPPMSPGTAQPAGDPVGAKLSIHVVRPGRSSRTPRSTIMPDGHGPVMPQVTAVDD